MKINLLNTISGLKPCYDDDYEEKKKLKIGETYTAEIRLERNPRFHRLYFALIACAWEYLPEKQTEGFRTKENFRKYVEVAAGHCEPYYSPKLKEWVEIPKSISFDSMDETEFKDLYERVKTVIFSIIGRFVSEDEFDNVLSNF
ncbi:MAG: DUF1367 family protein [Prevotella sp.]